MTIEEAQKIAVLISDVDNGCPTCVAAACRDFNKAFPKFIWQSAETDDGVVVVVVTETPQMNMREKMARAIHKKGQMGVGVRTISMKSADAFVDAALDALIAEPLRVDLSQKTGVLPPDPSRKDQMDACVFQSTFTTIIRQSAMASSMRERLACDLYMNCLKHLLSKCHYWEDLPEKDEVKRLVYASVDEVLNSLTAKPGEAVLEAGRGDVLAEEWCQHGIKAVLWVQPPPKPIDDTPIPF